VINARRHYRVFGPFERKFLEYSFSGNYNFIGMKVLGTFALKKRKFHWSECSTCVPWNESSTRVKVLSVDFSLPGTKVQRNEKAYIPTYYPRKCDDSLQQQTIVTCACRTRELDCQTGLSWFTTRGTKLEDIYRTNYRLAFCKLQLCAPGHIKLEDIYKTNHHV